MKIIPAIDLLDGACVRLYQGDYANSKVYGSDPVEMAVRMKSAGAERLHIVDLDAARGAGKHNREEISRIREAIDIVLQVGGGIRTEKDVQDLLDMGIDRLVLGTVLARDPETPGTWISRYGKRFIAGIDALNGRVKVSGWEEEMELSDLDLARTAGGLGFSGIIYTNIERDGTLNGPDLERSTAVAQASGLPVIVSGGVKNEDDFIAAKKLEPLGIVGVITGKALYEGTIDLKRIIALHQSGKENTAW